MMMRSIHFFPDVRHVTTTSVVRRSWIIIFHYYRYCYYCFVDKTKRLHRVDVEPGTRTLRGRSALYQWKHAYCRLLLTAYLAVFLRSATLSRSKSSVFHLPLDDGDGARLTPKTFRFLWRLKHILRSVVIHDNVRIPRSKWYELNANKTRQLIGSLIYVPLSAFENTASLELAIRLKSARSTENGQYLLCFSHSYSIIIIIHLYRVTSLFFFLSRVPASKCMRKTAKMPARRGYRFCQRCGKILFRSIPNKQRSNTCETMYTEKALCFRIRIYDDIHLELY